MSRRGTTAGPQKNKNLAGKRPNFFGRKPKPHRKLTPKEPTTSPEKAPKPHRKPHPAPPKQGPNLFPEIVKKMNL
jgi:hypothetical protein